MSTLTELFEERLDEIDDYIALLEAIEAGMKAGGIKIGGLDVTGRQQTILYSAVFLQLYNLVEGTAHLCLDAVTQASSRDGRWRPSHLSPELRKEWVRARARTHDDEGEDKRLEFAMKVFDLVHRRAAMSGWKIKKGGGGNWDEELIRKITERIGCTLTIPEPVAKDVKRFVQNSMGSLQWIRHLRNELAHGQRSFSECGANVTLDELKVIKSRVVAYLASVVASYDAFIETYQFLTPKRRPAPGGAN